MGFGSALAKLSRRRVGGASNGMPSFGGGMPHANGGYRPSLLGRLGNMANTVDNVNYALGGMGGISGMLGSIGNMAHYGEMTHDAWGIYNEVMEEGFTQENVGDIAGLLADGVLTDKLQDWGIPLPMAKMFGEMAQKGIEQLVEKFGQDAAKMPASAIAEATPGQPEGEAAQGQAVTPQALASNDTCVPQQGATSDTGVPAQSESTPTGKLSKIADWTDGISTAVGCVPVVGDVAGAAIGTIGAGCRLADGDEAGAAKSMAYARAALIPGPAGLAVNAVMVAYEMSGTGSTTADAAPQYTSSSTADLANIRNMFSGSGFGFGGNANSDDIIGTESRGCATSLSARAPAARGAVIGA